MGLDARVILHGAKVDADQLPRPAIRPCPTQYVVPRTAPKGEPVTIRPIRPEDEPLVVRFHEKLSILRFFQALKLSRRVAHERLTRVCFVDFNREMALVVESKNLETGEHEIIAMGRLSRVYNKDEAEFSLEVRDAFQRRGLGTRVLPPVIAIGREEWIPSISAVHTVFDADSDEVARLSVWAMISNATASLFITIWHPFQSGDTVELLPENFRGRVIGHNLMFTVLRMENGARLQVPNNHLSRSQQTKDQDSQIL